MELPSRQLWLVLLPLFIGIKWTLVLLLSYIIYYACCDMNGFLSLFKILRRDFGSLRVFLNGRLKVSQCMRKNLTIPDMFEATAAKYPNKVMVRSTEIIFTFEEARVFTNKMANCLLSMGFKAGDDVSLLMENRPEYVLLWVGLSKCGISAALINTNLKKDPLVHCITSVNSKAVIFSSDFADTLAEVEPSLTKNCPGIKYLCLGDHANNVLVTENLLHQMSQSPKERPDFRGNVGDVLFYMFTSGTTGLPKAAIIRHQRFLLYSCFSREVFGVTPEDVMYICLPLYHMSAGIAGICNALYSGTTTVVSKKFSASKFWQECNQFDCTVSPYIGETCRYLVAQPPSVEDRSHKMRLMFGGGLRREVWAELQERFGVTRIIECYGATEGTSTLANLDGTIGAVGFIPLFGLYFPKLMEKLHPVKVIRVDEKGVPIRDARGLCIMCKANEPGEVVCLVNSNPLNCFDGYSNKSENRKKLYRDVASKGDSAFASGDILVYDRYGYLYFKDRTGDTFRWKGENVSTTEVEGVISKIIKLTDVAVFGVPVPGNEGKAGMAVIAHEGDLDMASLLHSFRETFPSYAIPLFLRLTASLELTATYKLKKVQLMKEGYNVNVINDRMYYLNIKERKYLPLSVQSHTDIVEGKLRF